MLQTNIHMCSGNAATVLQFIIVDIRIKLLLFMGSAVRVTWSKCNVKVVGDDTAINNLWRLIDTADLDT